MKKQTEEAAAAALWAYVERIRDTDGTSADEPDAMTPSEAAELVALFRTASDLTLGLEDAASTNAQGAPAAAERVKAAIAVRVRSEAAVRPIRPSPVREWLRAPGRWATLGLASAAVLAAFWTGQHWSPVPAPVPGPDPNGLTQISVHRMDCAEFHRQLTPLVAGKITRAQKAAILWHATNCPPCLDAYHTAQHEHDRAPAPGACAPDPLIRTADRAQFASR